MPYEILLIESSETDRQDIGHFLESLEYQLHYAKDSKEGLKAFNDIRPDLVIVEVLLSGNLNGLQVCKAIKSQAPDWAKVIVISKLYQSRAMSKDALDKYNADGYVEKPFNTRALYRLIHKLIGSPKIAKKKKDSKAKATDDTAPEAAPPSQAQSAAVTAESTKQAPTQAPSGKSPSQSPSAAAAEVAPEVEEETDEVFTEGEVTRETLARLLNSCFRKKVNSVLIVEYPEGTKHVFLVDGLPVFVQSNIRKESLGQILLNDGHLTPDQYQIVLEEAATTKQKIGSICVRKGFLTSKQLYDILTDQTVIKIANCFAWESGKYKVDPERTYPKNAPIFEASPSQILLRAYRSFVPFSVLEERFEKDADLIVFAGKPTWYGDLEKNLDEKQRQFVQSANGKTTMRELVARHKPGRTDAIRLAYALLAMEVFTLGAVKRDKELDAYSPDPAVCESGDIASDKLANRINEMYMRLENEDPGQLLGLEGEPSESELARRYNRMKKRFDSTILEAGCPKTLRQKLASINNGLDQAYQKLCEQPIEQPGDQAAPTESVPLPMGNGAPLQPAAVHPAPAAAPTNTVASELAYQKGVHAMERNKYHVAVDYFTKACNLEPNTGAYQVHLGYAIFRMISTPQYELDEAVAFIQKGLDLSPGERMGHRMLAEIAKYEGDFKTAIEQLTRVIQEDPEDEEAELELKELQEVIAKMKPRAR